MINQSKFISSVVLKKFLNYFNTTNTTIFLSVHCSNEAVVVVVVVVVVAI